MTRAEQSTAIAILTQLANMDGGVAPAAVAAEHDWELYTVLATLEKLEDRGLVAANQGGTYAVTDDGKAYLEGDREVVESAEGAVPDWLSRRPSWMETADVQVMEQLAGRDDPVPVSELADELGYPEDHLKARCEELMVQGLVQPVEGYTYQLRDIGRAFVSGDLDPAFLESE